MMLIADSGSTKTDWLGYANNEFLSIKTLGYNPFHVDSSFILSDLKSSNELNSIKEEISSVHFYGAGCSSKTRNDIVKSGLQAYFGNIDITVDHDMIAAARALFGENSGVAAIMGTGSNVSYYDGKNIYNEIPALGFVMGDEGGGSDIGKRFMKMYQNKRMSAELSGLFNDYLDMTTNEVLDRIYRVERPNEFLASIIPFVKENIDFEEAKTCVEQSINEFFKIYVSHYQSRSSNLGIVGSIGMVFSDIVKEQAGKYDFEASKFLKNPIMDLYKFHEK